MIPLGCDTAKNDFELQQKQNVIVNNVQIEIQNLNNVHPVGTENEWMNHNPAGTQFFFNGETFSSRDAAVATHNCDFRVALQRVEKFLEPTKSRVQGSLKDTKSTFKVCINRRARPC